MANLPISGLTASAANLASTDLLPVVQTVGVGPVKMTGLQLAGGLLGSTALTGATVTTSKPVLNLSQTWNDGAGGTVTFTGLRFNATDTASAAGSLLLDIGTGGGTYVSAFSVTKGAAAQFSSATLRLGAADAAAPVAQTFQVQSVVAGTSNTAGANWTLRGSAGTGTGAGGSILFQVAPAGASGTAQNAFQTALTIDSTGAATFAQGTLTVQAGTGSNIIGIGAGYALNLPSNGLVQWSSTAVFNGTRDLILARDAANTLALKNSTNPQIFRAYSTTTGPSYGYLAAGVTDAGVATADTLFVGTGGVGAAMTKFNVVINGTSRLDFNSTNAGQWWMPQSFQCGGTFTAQNVYATADVRAGSTSSIYWASRTNMTSPSDGVLYLANFAQTDFNRLQFGGTTSSFPSLKRSSATLAVRLADDSADAAITCLYAKTGSTTVASLPSASTAGAGARMFVTDANATTFLTPVAGGGSNKVPVVSDGTNWLIG